MKKNSLRKKRDELIEKNLQEKLDKLKLGRGQKYFLTQIDYPQRQKEKDKATLFLRTKIIEDNLLTLRNLIKEVKKSFGRIFDQDKYTALYLLLGKALSNLEAGILLSKSGYVEELLELSRSGHESIDLAFLFLEDENKALLSRWFKGEIIDNNTARQFSEKELNKAKILDVPIEFAKAKGDIYHAYSLSTHSQYTALVDSIDVFYEDLDYYKYAGFHHSAKLVYYLQSLYTNILLLLKKIYTEINQSNIDKIDKLLDAVLPKVPDSEVEQMLKKYKKVKDQ